MKNIFYVSLIFCVNVYSQTITNLPPILNGTCTGMRIDSNHLPAYSSPLPYFITFDRDSTWNLFDYSDHISIDSSEGYVVKRITKRYEIDSSRYYMYKLEKGNAYYVKLFDYGTMVYTEYPKDSVEKWSKKQNRFKNLMMFSGYSDLVGHIERQYRRSPLMFSECNFKDTIPEVTTLIDQDSLNWIYRKVYYVPNMMGVLIRSEIYKTEPKTKNEIKRLNIW